MSRGSMVPCNARGSKGGLRPGRLLFLSSGHGLARACVCAHVQMLGAALLRVISVVCYAKTWGVVRGCVRSMFTAPRVNISDVPRCVELQALMFRPGALSPVLVYVPGD
eukprot:3782101-Alexandrium_andersonii.AAC.1